MMMVEQDWTTYVQQLDEWRQSMETQLRAADGWLTVVGLEWLHEGENTVGSNPASDVVLPESAPERVGVISFHDGQATLTVMTDQPVLVDGTPVTTADLRHDHHPGGASLVNLEGITLHIIRRGDEYAVRVRDANSPARRTFGGRAWFPPDASYHLTARFTPHPTERQLEVENSAGKTSEMANPGYVDFELNGEPIRLQAFKASGNQLWIVFRDSTSGTTTYGAGRFVYAQIMDDGSVDLDLNKAYHPPCAFTVYATCPLPPRENVLSIPIEAGEKFPERV